MLQETVTIAERVLAIDEKAMGSDHPKVARVWGMNWGTISHILCGAGRFQVELTAAGTP